MGRAEPNTGGPASEEANTGVTSTRPRQNLGPLAAEATGLSGGGDGLALGSALGPTLREVCDGRLGEIEWFRSTWQRSEAATGFATWRLGPQQTVPVMIKLPVGPHEHAWTRRLGALDIEDWNADHALACPAPRLAAAGEALAGYDLCWLVMERFDGHPLSSRVDADSLRALLDAAARFQQRAVAACRVQRRPDRADWAHLIDRSREVVGDGALELEQRWRQALKRVHRSLDKLADRWESRPCESWCHGDLHPGNAMWRTLPDGSRRCCLIDLALVHAGHWVEDAAYLERLYWGHGDRLHGVDPVAVLGQARRALGLPVGTEAAELADIRRLLTAACVPCFLGLEGRPRYVKHALEVAERLIPRLC